MKNLLLILALLTTGSVYGESIKDYQQSVEDINRPSKVERKPAVLEEDMIIENFNTEEDEQLKELQKIDEGPIKEEAKVKNNHILIHAGIGLTSNEAWVEDFELESEEVYGFVMGLQYSRTNIFKIKEVGLGLTGVALSHKTYLVGAQASYKKFEFGLLGGMGITDIKVSANLTDPFNPQLSEEVQRGFVGAFQSQYHINKDWLIHFMGTTNKTYSGGLGFSF